MQIILLNLKIWRVKKGNGGVDDVQNVCNRLG